MDRTGYMRMVSFMTLSTYVSLGLLIRQIMQE